MKITVRTEGLADIPALETKEAEHSSLNAALQKLSALKQPLRSQVLKDIHHLLDIYEGKTAEAQAYFEARLMELEGTAYGKVLADAVQEAQRIKDC